MCVCCYGELIMFILANLISTNGKQKLASADQRKQLAIKHGKKPTRVQTRTKKTNRPRSARTVKQSVQCL